MSTLIDLGRVEDALEAALECTDVLIHLEPEHKAKPEAPVVWGMQHLQIRGDFILLSQSFFDEDLVLVKTMTCHDIRQLGGRLYPSRWRMQKSDVGDEYTEIIYRQLTFKDTLPASFFTLSSLRTRRK